MFICSFFETLDLVSELVGDSLLVLELLFEFFDIFLEVLVFHLEGIDLLLVLLSTDVLGVVLSLEF